MPSLWSAAALTEHSFLLLIGSLVCGTLNPITTLSASFKNTDNQKTMLWKKSTEASRKQHTSCTITKKKQLYRFQQRTIRCSFSCFLLLCAYCRLVHNTHADQSVACVSIYTIIVVDSVHTSTEETGAGFYRKHAESLSYNSVTVSQHALYQDSWNQSNEMKVAIIHFIIYTSAFLLLRHVKMSSLEKVYDRFKDGAVDPAKI